ncbi:MAG: NAD(P)H-binding protein [Chloroflexi bacterium]|nr:NAD(P)H-binding protein [Chloroflexota bacterium]
MTGHNNNASLTVVTGAFGFTGRHIAQRLLDAGKSVRTLTGRPHLHGSAQDPFHGQVEAVPFNFLDPVALAKSLEGVDTLYNTYWVRFSSGAVTFDQAVENSRILVNAAVEAGVQRLVHVSITNPAEDSPLPYFRGKALVERAIRESGLSHAIVRPALLFGEGDILLNNIAWALRRFPVFPVAGNGHYRAQPVYVGDLADLAVSAAESRDNITIDAVGPDTYTFDELVYLLEKSVGSRARIAHMPSALALSLSRIVGYFVRDIVLTREEIDGLAGDLLVSAEPPRAATRLSDWLADNGMFLGENYASELDRHYRARGRGLLGN